jgi:hypothetical protein
MNLADEVVFNDAVIGLAIVELNELETSFVGGGIGDISLG